MEDYKEYVLGFAFNKAKTHVILIEKQKPSWQKGKLNGVGGKIELYDKKPVYAMIREFEEETGLKTNILHWHLKFATMIFKEDITGGSAKVYCFRMFSDDIFKCKTTEEEKITCFEVNNLPDNIIKNLKVLIPMVIDEDFEGCVLNVF